MTMQEAIKSVEHEMGRQIVRMGFDEREHGSRIVNILWYAMRNDIEPGPPNVRYRLQVFVDGKRVTGVEV